MTGASRYESSSVHPLLTVLACFFASLLLTTTTASGATNFGTDYRLLTTTSPGSTAVTTTTISISAGSTSDYIVNPYTSGSTSTGSPNSSSLTGFGWRSSGVVGSVISAGEWEFTITTISSLIGGNAVAKVYAYSADPLGGDVDSIGSATGSTNILGSIFSQQQTLSFTTVSSTDLTNKVLVVEYWIDVTSGPLLSTTVTFSAGSSSQTIVLPSSGTYYLDTESLYSIGESESTVISDGASRSIVSARSSTENAIVGADVARTQDVTRTQVEQETVADQIAASAHYGRTISQGSGLEIIDTLSSISVYNRVVSESSDAAVQDDAARNVQLSRNLSEDPALTGIVERTAQLSRNLDETTAAIVSDSVAKISAYARGVSETGAQVIDNLENFAHFSRSAMEIGLISDVIARSVDFTRQVTDGSTLIDVISAIVNAVIPPDGDGEESEDNRRSNGGGGRRSAEPVSATDSFRLGLELLRVSFRTEGKGFPISESALLQSITVLTEIRNPQQFEQDFVMLLQVKDEKDIVIEIITVPSAILPDTTQDFTSMWIPKVSGNNVVQIMLVDNLDHAPTLLAPEQSLQFAVR